MLRREKSPLVDSDPQANATSGAGVVRDKSRKTLYDALVLGRASPREMVLPTAVDTLWVLPADKDLAGREVELVDAEDRHHALKKVLEGIRDYFHYLIVDCPPSLGILTVNGLTAADSLLVPIQCEYYALEGVTELFDTLGRLRRELNPDLAIEGLLLTMYDDRTNLRPALQRISVSFTVRRYLKRLFRGMCVSPRLLALDSRSWLRSKVSRCRGLRSACKGDIKK